MTNAESWILSYLANSIWQLPLLFAAGWLAARALRPLGATAEHRAWVTVLILQALLPAIATEWLRAVVLWLVQPHAAENGSVSVILGPATALGGVHLPTPFLTIAAGAYAMLALYFLARFIWRCLRLASIRRRAGELTLSRSQAEIFARTQQSFGVDNVLLHLTAELRVPVTLGFRNNIILLPDTLVPALNDADFRTVIEHEFAHIRRHDFARNLAYELLSLPISYHPLLRLTRERLTETREMICDQLAAEHAGALEYGRSLLRLASLLVLGPPVRRLHAIGIFDSNSLERRLMRLKEIRKTPQTTRRAVLIAACALLVLATCASALTLRVNVSAPFAATIDASGSGHPMTVPAAEAAEHVLTKVTPTYPPDAKKSHTQGVVTLKAIIGDDGKVEKLSVISGPAKLQQSALDAVRQWTYKPFLLNGQPTAVETTVHVTYSLAK